MDLTNPENIRDFTKVAREAMSSVKDDPNVTADNYMDAMFHALHSVNPAYNGATWLGEDMPEVEGHVWIHIYRDHINFYKIDTRSVYQGRAQGLRKTIERQVKGLKPALHEIIQQRGMDVAYGWQEASPPIGTKKYDENAYSQSFNHWVLVTKENAMLLKLEHETPSKIRIYGDKDNTQPA